LLFFRDSGVNPISSNPASAGSVARIRFYDDALPYYSVIGLDRLPISTLQFDTNYYAVDEGNSSATLNVTRNGDTNGFASVEWAAVGGTATPGIDYLPTNGAVNFGPGDTSQPITITLLNDPMAMGDLSVLVELTNSVAAYIGDPSEAVLTILDGSTNLPQADLSITQTAGPDPVMAGQDILYTLLVYNAGPDYSSNVVVTDDLPLGTSFDGSSLETNSYDPTTQQVTFPIGDLAPGQTGMVTVAVLTSNVGPIVNFACASSDTFDPNTNNNCSSITNTVIEALPPTDVGVGIATSSDVGTIGSLFTYTITVTNFGPGEATGVELDNSLPVNITLGSYTTSQGSISVSGVNLTAELGNMDVGAVVTVVVSGTPTNDCILQDVATVLLDETDINPTNNMAGSEIPIAEAPMIAMQPNSYSTYCGHFAELSVIALGPEPLTYQWMSGGSPIAGATKVDLELGQVFLANDGSQYSVMVSNPYGSATSSNATLHVMDNSTPELLVPDTMTVPCEGMGGAVVTYNVAATDNCDTNITSVCDPPSGTFFPLGSNWVQCSAVAASGNTITSGFAIIVIDTNSPNITVPDPIEINCATNDGAPVNYLVTASEDCDPNVTLVCTPPSGSVFPLGETIVECVATDSSGNSSEAEFVVTVVNTTPVLEAIQLLGTNVAISWPSSCQQYQLYSSPQLGSGAVWTPVEAPATLMTNQRYCVELPDFGEETFFILAGKETINSVIAKANGEKTWVAKPGDSVAFTVEAMGENNTKGFTFAWDFGDGTTSTSQNPTHAYTNAGMSYTATVTVTSKADPTLQKSDKVEVIVPMVQIVRDDGMPLATALIVAVQCHFHVTVTPAIAGATYQWSLSGNNMPPATVAIFSYTPELYNDNGNTTSTGVQPMPYKASQLQNAEFQGFFVAATAPAKPIPLAVTVTAPNKKTFPTMTPLTVKQDADPNMDIYALLAPDADYNPDGSGGLNKVTEEHADWHAQGSLGDTGVFVFPATVPATIGARKMVFGKYDESLAQFIAAKANLPAADAAAPTPAQIKSFTLFRGAKWFRYHTAMINAHNAWRSFFSDPTPVPTNSMTLGPTPPSYYSVATVNGSLASQVYKYVRASEYVSLDQLGRDVHPWHIAGHGNAQLVGNTPMGALVGAAMLPGIATLNNVPAPKNIFWSWHGIIEAQRLMILPSGSPLPASPATMTATDPVASPAPPGKPNIIAKGKTQITIVFNKSVSVNGPADANEPDRANESCARDNSLQVTSPTGVVAHSTAVAYSVTPAVAPAMPVTNALKLIFTVPAMNDPGAWKVVVPGNDRGFKTVSFSFTVKD
jgi:uncharacterized repeat protein (TIGR01451 family)